ncbi:MAG: hypothetical protein LBP37_04980 [Spirochaetaceae bacterium]|jgi:MoaA/NifB/PqqE/SkfB family radical SAM enzyme|nr:hypothetical protein [Spirochaetaceae bacterium]
MDFQNIAAQTLKKIVSPEGIIYKGFRLINQYAVSFKRLKKRTTLEVVAKVTDHCNLNCACCNQFSPVSDEFFYSVETFKKDCLRLFRLGGKRITKISFSGGEPLLHPQITDFFDAARECFEIHRGGGVFAL